MGLLIGSSVIASSPCLAAAILIVNGSSTTAETGTTSSITTQLSSLHTAAGNTVTVVDSVPLSLSGYAQVWDLRFSNSSPLTPTVSTEYLNYLQGGGGMFLMGENSSFATRNTSLINFISAAGGGSLAFAVPGDTQTVYSPFTGPNPLISITYSAAGGVNGFGTGQWITANAAGTAGTGVAWGVGSLGNAQAGTLTTIFDVNFLQTNASPSNQALASNLVRFVGQQVGGVPEPATWAMMLVGFGAVGFRIRRRRQAAPRLEAA